MLDTLLGYWDGIPPYVRTGILVVVAAFLVLKVWEWISGAGKSMAARNTQLVMLIRTAARYAAAAEQDASPLMTLMHANYAAAYLQVLREQHDLADLQAAAHGVDFAQLQQSVLETQNRAQARMAETCPAAAPASALEAYSLMA